MRIIADCVRDVNYCNVRHIFAFPALNLRFFVFRIFRLYLYIFRNKV